MKALTVDEIPDFITNSIEFGREMYVPNSKYSVVVQFTPDGQYIYRDGGISFLEFMENVDKYIAKFDNGVHIEGDLSITSGISESDKNCKFYHVIKMITPKGFSKGRFITTLDTFVQTICTPIIVFASMHQVPKEELKQLCESMYLHVVFNNRDWPMYGSNNYCIQGCKELNTFFADWFEHGISSKKMEGFRGDLYDKREIMQWIIGV